MPRIKPYAGTSRERLSELIRVSQHPALPKSVKYTYSNLKEGAIPANGDAEVTVVASVDTRVDDPVTIKYTRLDLDVLTMLPEGFVLSVPGVEVPFSIHSILPLINTALGIDLVPEEVLNQTFTEQDIRYPLTITGNKSFAWYDSVTYFKMDSLDIDLAIAIPDPVLDGLEYIQP